MALTLFGQKLGMTRVFNDQGASIPVTVIRIGENVVTQIRTKDKDGYEAVQVGYGEMKARNSTMQLIGHDAKAGTDPKRCHGEFKLDPAKKDNPEFTLGQVLTIKDLGAPAYVDVTGQSKGKGFQGTMKRHNFKGLFASHGTERKHRSPGSIGSLGSNRGFGGGLKKGKKMAGHMGDERITTRNLDVIRIDEAEGIILVKGPIPGANTGVVRIRPSIRLGRSKGKKLAEAAKK